LVDAPVSGTGAARRGGSSPLLGTICSFFHDLQLFKVTRSDPGFSLCAKSF
jgi:hypothetical protein